MNSSPSSLELKISLFQKIISLIFVVGVVSLLGRFLWIAPSAPRGVDFVWFAITAGVTVVGCVAIYYIARRAWFETGLYVRSDDESLVVDTRSGRRTMAWEEIYAVTLDRKSTTGIKGQWVTIRGNDGNVLAQWNRNWCLFSDKQIERSHEIEEFALQKMQKMGRLEGEKIQYLPLWEQLSPYPHSEVLEMKDKANYIGWVCLPFFLACTFFSWNAETGGPLVGSVFLAFSFLGIWLILANGTLRISEEFIEVSSVIKRSHIEWDRVTDVKLGNEGRTMVFEGNGKRVTLNSPMFWRGPNASKVFILMAAQCEKRQVPFPFAKRTGKEN